MNRRCAVRCAVAGLLAVFAAPAAIGAGHADAEPADSIADDEIDTAAYHAVGPCRLLDTRDDGASRPGANTVVTVPTDGRCGIDAGAIALSLTVTATEPAAAGFVTVWPGATPRPETSVVNVAAGETRANGAIIALGPDGSLAVAASMDTHVVIDVTGAFVTTDASAAGRLVASSPRRLLDTREFRPPLARGESITLPLPDGVSPDATALAVTIAVDESAGAGFFTAFPSGVARPESSSLNTDGRGQIRATGQIVPVTADGFTVFAQSGGHLVVDMTGWFTGTSADVSSDGLFVPSVPTRLLDTRPDRVPVYAGGTIELDPTAITGGPVAAVAANWTLTRTWRAGFVTVHPARTERPVASTANTDRHGQNVAQFGITSTSEHGLAAFASAGTDLVVDVTGWFTGTPQAATSDAVAPNTPVANLDRRVLMVGDSTLAGVRWYTNSQQALGGSNFVLDAESCRRLIGTSCRGREGRTPPNAITAIDDHVGTFDVVVIMTGYNDWSANFSAAFDQVVAAARSKGAYEIVWLTYREGSAYRNPTGGTAQDQGFRLQNQIMRDKVASGAFPDVRIADWNEYTTSTEGWFTSDGVHFTLAGAYGAADYISRQVAYTHHEPCPAPWTLGGTVDVPCGNPDSRSGIVDPITLYAANPNDIHCYSVGNDHHVECRVDPKLLH